MRKLILVLSLVVSSAAFARKPTCEIKADRWYNSTNHSMYTYRPIALEECMRLGQELFDSEVQDGFKSINPLKNTVTRKSWSTQHKRVKIIHHAEDGIKTVETLTRPEVIKSPVTVVVVKVKSGFSCWTKGDCEPVEE